MNRIVASEVECVLTGLIYHVMGDAPGEGLAPSTLKALAYLRNNEHAEWAKAARIRHPNGFVDWIIETSEDDFGERSIQHGAVYRSDVVEGYAVESDDSSQTTNVYQGRLDEKLTDGVDFRVRREHLEHPDVKPLLGAAVREVQQAAEDDTDEESGP